MNIHKLDCSPLTLIVTKRDAVMSNETPQADRSSHLILCVLHTCIGDFALDTSLIWLGHSNRDLNLNRNQHLASELESV